MAQVQLQVPSSTKKRERSRKGFEPPALPIPSVAPKKAPTPSESPWDLVKAQEFTTPPCDSLGQPATGSLGGKRSKFLQQKRLQRAIPPPLFDQEDEGAGGVALPKRAVQALFVSDDSGSNTTSPRALTGKTTLHLGDVQFSPAKLLVPPQTVVKPKRGKQDDEGKTTPPIQPRRLGIDPTSEERSSASLLRFPLGSFGDRESFSLRRGSMTLGNERESISISKRESSKFDNLEFHEYDYHEDINSAIQEEDISCVTPSQQQAKSFDWENQGSRSPSSTNNDMLRSPVSSYRGPLKSPRMSMTEDYGSPRSVRFSCSFRPLRDTPGPKIVERQRSGSLLSLVPESDAFLEKEHLQQVPQTVIKKKKGREPPPTPLPHRLSRQNSLYDDKMLFLSLQALKLDGWGENRSNPVTELNEDYHGRIFATEFVNHKQVGSGAFFDVFRVEQRRTGKPYAVKRTKRAFRSKKDRSEYLREIQMVSTLALHRNIITYYRAWQEELHFLIQMEYCHSNLSDFVSGRTLSERFLWDCFQQIAQGLSHVHKGGLIHLDIKPENILVELKQNKAVYKLGDFGQARLPDHWTDGSEGDSQYVAPEVISHVKGGTDPTAAADVFSLGLLMFELSSRYTLPKNGELWHDLRSGSASQELPIAMEKIQCPGLKSLIMRCLEPDPLARITADEIVGIAASHLSARGAGGGA